MKKQNQNFNDVVKALKRANRDIQFERNGGGHFVANTKIHQSTKTYNRKKDKQALRDLLSFSL
jgi:hypothetical protein